MAEKELIKEVDVLTPQEYAFGQSTNERVYLEDPTTKRYCDIVVEYDGVTWKATISSETIGTTCKVPVILIDKDRDVLVKKVGWFQKFVLDMDYDVKIIVQEGNVIYRK